MVVKNKSPKPKPKPVINYPPVTRKKWVPPDQRPKKPKEPAYVKPQGVTQKLAISSLNKVWHSFKVYGTSAVLAGSICQTHKRFRPKTNGLQGPCNCVVAVAFSHIYEMSQWLADFVDKILETGDGLYLKSLQKLDNKSKTELSVPEVYNTFFLKDTKIQMSTETKMSGDLYKQPAGCSTKTNLLELLNKYFSSSKSGIVVTQKKQFAVWTAAGAYYLFDPNERDERAQTWKGIPGKGYATVTRVTNINKLYEALVLNLSKKGNITFSFYPCSVLKMVKVNTQPPENMEELLPKARQPSSATSIVPPVKDQKEPKEAKEPKETEKEAAAVEKQPAEVVGTFEPDPAAETEEFAPDIEAPETASKAPSWMKDVQIVKTTIPPNKVPKEPAKAESVTFFRELIPQKLGILRSNFHQSESSRYGKYAGHQSIGVSVMTLAMLRIRKAKTWIPKVLDDILDEGTKLYREITKKFPGNATVEMSHVPEKITLENKQFAPDIEEFSIIGKLRSQADDVLDLLPALEEFFIENDTCIINGPSVLAVWQEDGNYYMFDSCERDNNGLLIMKTLRVGSEEKVLEYTAGKACVTWYKDLKDLVDVYTNNLDKSKRKDQFWLSRVSMNDFIPLPDPWYNFTGISSGKWILRGTFNQNNPRFSEASRNTQCTANATMALAYSSMKPEREWSSKTVDDILIVGDKFYNSCVAVLKAGNRFVNPMLLVDELQRQLEIEDKEIRLEIEDCLVNGIINARDDNDIPNLRKGFEEFFRDNDTGVVTARSISIAIWKKNEIYYYYDSHSRDERGVIGAYGTACVLRILNLEELAKSVQTNLGPSSQDFYNISRVGVRIWEMVDDVVRPPLNNYREINKNTAILQSQYHELSQIFDLNRGKQTVPMCLMALGMAKLFPSEIWSAHLLDEILKLGNGLYVSTMQSFEKTDGDLDMALIQNADESTLVATEMTKPNQTVTSKNVLKTFKIGINKMNVTFKEEISGNLEADLSTRLLEYFSDKEEETPEEKEHKKPLLLESEPMTLVIWKHSGIFYLFDSKPRDDTGQAFGKDQWSAKVIKEEPDLQILNDDRTVEEIEQGEGEAGRYEAIADPAETEEEKKLAAEKKKERTDRLKRIENEAASKGHACAMWFTDVNKLTRHILENIPPNSRDDSFTVKPIEMINTPDVKQVFDPKSSARTDLYAGDWYDFKEIDKGKWILRGTMNQDNEIFPIHNRNKQALTNCYSALAFACLYATAKFKYHTVNAILKYGDRLYTFTKNQKKQAMRRDKDLELTAEEIEQLVNIYEYQIEDVVRKFCIADDLVTVNLTACHISGDIKAKNTENILDVKRGLETYFEGNSFAILSARKVHVAVWRGQKVFYMFDPYSRGPSGLSSPNGDACVTRYLHLDKLAEVFLANLPVIGSTVFEIHKVEFKMGKCERAREPEKRPEKKEEPLPTSFVTVSPGKRVLRGTVSQDDEKFDKGKNVLCAPIAIVALTMTLIHKCATWSGPILDEIVTVGDELYNASLDSLGFKFNPWERKLDIELVQNDFKIGVLKANFELRHTDQRGIIDIKSSHMRNLRQGIERFFEENTHGVLQTETLTVALWENEEDNLIYMFDPNPRGITGMPAPYGFACLVTFANAKIAADHVIACIVDEKQKRGEFVITPVEIVVGGLRTKRKTTRSKTAEETEQKRRMRLLAEEARKREEEKRIATIGRVKYDAVSDEMAILRGTRSQGAACYSVGSRNHQDIPNCIVAYVMNRLQPIDGWRYKHVDIVLDAGEQLYVDSYITYKPQDLKLGLKNVMRTFCIKDVKVHVGIYKPSIREPFLLSNLKTAFSNWFQQETFAMLGACNKWISVFVKSGLYYVFDPHDYNHEGKKAEIGKGCAVVMRYETIETMAAAILNNLVDDPSDPIGRFEILMLCVKDIKKKT